MTATMMTGTYRVVHMDAQDLPLKVILEKPSAQLGAGGTAGSPQTNSERMATIRRREMPIIAEDEKLVIQFKPDTTQTEAASGNAHTKTYKIPVTFYNLRSQMAFEKTFTEDDFTTQRASAASQAWAAGEWFTLDEYQVPAQAQIVLGETIQDNRVDGKIALQFDIVT